ncbi:lasso peptide biosynthesis B2 protein [Streptomyces mexicanus]|uniref:lasso peptide biosynthesis B2 protein n=1 Tax=Streptomyces mexicanus TaxID=178566 RepID=UPI0036679367
MGAAVARSSGADASGCVGAGGTPAAHGTAVDGPADSFHLPASDGGECSLATALSCRIRGSRPTWCTGVRTPPFTAHTRIEAEGRSGGEPADTTAYRTNVTVRPPRRHRAC